MTINGWVSMEDGKPRWETDFSLANRYYRKITLWATKGMGEQLWADVRRATLTIDEPKKRGQK